MNTLSTSNVPGGGAPFNFPSFSGFEEMLSEISSYSETKSEITESVPSSTAKAERPTKHVSHRRKHNQRQHPSPEFTCSEAQKNTDSSFIPGINTDTPTTLLFDDL